MLTCHRCQQPATKRDGYDAAGRQRYHCRPCQRDFTTHSTSVFSGYRWPPDVILMAVRWYCSLPLSAAQVVGLLASVTLTFHPVQCSTGYKRSAHNLPPRCVCTGGGSAGNGRSMKCSAFAANRNSNYTVQSTSTGKSLMCCCVTNAIGPVRRLFFDRLWHAQTSSPMRSSPTTISLT